MEMLHIPPAQPKAAPKPTQAGKAADRPERSFAKVLDTTRNSDEPKGTEESVTPSETTEVEEVKPGKVVQKNPAEEANPTEEEKTSNLVCTATGIENQRQEPARPVLEDTTADDTKPLVETAAVQASRKPMVSLPTKTLLNGTGTEPLITEEVSGPSQSQEASAAKSAPMTETAHKNTADRPPTSVMTEAAVPATQTTVLKDPQQAAMAGSETVTRGGLMENSLSSLAQEVRPLREDLRGRLTANQSREDGPSLTLSGQGPAKIATGVQNESSADAFASEGHSGFPTSATEGAAKGADPLAGSTTFDSLLGNGTHNAMANQPTNQPLQTPSAIPGSIPLTSGGYITENQVVNQVLERLSLDRNGDQSRIVIKMNPEELGEVKLSLTMEKDQLRAQLLTQNQQVQEILEKHLPKLHEALGKQGLKLDEIQVGVDANPHSGRESFANHRRPDSFRRIFNDPAVGLGNNPLPTVAAARMTSAEGISLRI